MERLSSSKSFSGMQEVYAHDSSETKTKMRLAVFTPPGEGPFPALFWLSGLTCTEENFTVKAGAQRIAAELGLMIVAPDTSPRGLDRDGAAVPDDPDGAYDFGLGAGFYVDATAAPWSKHYRMYSYINDELHGLVARTFPADMDRVAISGHSMGGHGALTIALKNPGKYKSVSAFAPIASPMNCPWGEKALTGYLGGNRATWRAYDSCALIESGARLPDILVDQGTADQFLESQLKPERLVRVCADAKQPLTFRMQDGYDHSYYFIATFIEDHLRWHRARLG